LNEQTKTSVSFGGEELIRLIFSHYEKFDPKYRMLLPMKRTYVVAPLNGEMIDD
jgi:restriction system protein